MLILFEGRQDGTTTAMYRPHVCGIGRRHLHKAHMLASISRITSSTRGRDDSSPTCHSTLKKP